MTAPPDLPPIDPAPLDRAWAASLLGWWIDAGVDTAIGDGPRDWLKPLAEAPVVAVAAAATPVGEPADLSTLDGYRAWLGSASGLPLDRPGARRVLPSGAIGAPVMLLSDLPGPDEAVHGRSIAGEAWVLAERMLAAIGIAPDAAYLAALACFHSPGARLDKADLERCGTMARDHIRLAAPERLILFGDAPARALLGQPLGDARGRIHRVEGVRTIATFHPRWLLKRASDKALAWRDLLLLMSEDG